MFGLRKHSIDDLKDYVARERSQSRPIDRRSRVKILIIDDHEFPARQNLQSHGFVLQQVNDIHDLRTVADYQIILCDLQGVGTTLNARLQGGHLIKEIKDNYPDKVIIAYTGGAKAYIKEAALVASDDYIVKDESIEAWVEKLDLYCEKLTNPIEVWKALRVRILEAGVNLKQLIVMEHRFVEAIRKKGPSDRDSVVKSIMNSGLPNDIRGIVQQLVASAIAALLF